MTSSREDLAERLRKHLSLSEPRSCKDLLALAGISIRGGIAQTAGLALVDLQKKGLAKQTTGAKADAQRWQSLLDSPLQRILDSPAQRALARLDTLDRLLDPMKPRK